MAKDLVLSLLWLGSLLWCGSDPRPRNFHMPLVWPKIIVIIIYLISLFLEAEETEAEADEEIEVEESELHEGSEVTEVTEETRASLLDDSDIPETEPESG